jgi:hypothetical protein
MLAPDLAAENVASGSAAGPRTTTPEPFELYGGGKAPAPRLFGYINGGHGR